MIELLNSKGKYCTGCGACYNICPNDAIHMEPDAQGFLYPIVDENWCIHCRKCEWVCPKLETNVENSPNPDCYAARAKDDIRAVSSSGGIFTLLSRWILSQNGIVCGAAMEDNYKVHHICVSDEKGLEKLRKSKYVQSNTEYVYREITQHLKNGRIVLFSGCPCQVAAARKYFGNEEKNIYYVDILCHGTPSQQMWDDYLKENFHLDSVKSVDFRNKKNGWRADQLFVTWKDGSTQAIPWPESAYEEGFQRNISLRDGCEECEFSGYQRQGDITIGDFWQVEKYKPELNDHKGTSVILVNNQTGQKLLDAIRPELLDLQRTPIEAAKYNRMRTTFQTHPRKARFKTLYPGHSFTDAIFQCRHDLYDIGLVGNYTIGNYGGSLTQYALYSTITKMGYSVLMIERPLDAPEPPDKTPWLFEKSPYPEYALAKKFASIADMKFLNKQCKIFVTGSDQMFNNNLYNSYAKIPVQNFVQSNHWKIAYAASFGHDRIWGKESDRAEESFFMQRFDRFSVREDSAVAMCKNLFGVDATWVLDPVFTAPQEIYLDLIHQCKKKPPKEPFLFAYVLDPNKEKEDILNEVAARHNLRIRAISDLEYSKETAQEKWSIDTLFDVKIESWLSHIYHCDYFITDSFHGMCFAIMFHKQFLVIVNKRRGETRFTSLTRLLGLEDRLCYSKEELRFKSQILKRIDYTEVERKLNIERERSRAWLYEAIEAGRAVKKPFDTFDILDQRCDDCRRRLDQRCNELEQEVRKLCRILEVQTSLDQKNPKHRPWVLEKIHGGYQCIKENGWKYTIHRLIKKIF